MWDDGDEVYKEMAEAMRDRVRRGEEPPPENPCGEISLGPAEPAALPPPPPPLTAWDLIMGADDDAAV